MKRPITLAVLLCCLTVSATANEAAVVRLSGCSGVCISADGLILTADHCGSEATVPVRFPDGSEYTAQIEYLPPLDGLDEAQSYRIPGVSGLPVATLADSAPKAGDTVWSVGYPMGNYQKNQGRILKVGFTTVDDTSFEVRIDDGLVTNWQSDGGNSGGPLFNADGKVVGLLSMSGADDSYWIGLSSIRSAMTDRKSEQQAYRRNPIVCFVTDGCAPCDRLKFDARAGKLGAYDFQWVHYDQDLGVWSDPVLAREFAVTAKAPAGLGFPVIWIRGTPEYRVGYLPDRRGGLVGWIAGVFDGLGRLIIGEKPSPEFPPLTPQPVAPDEIPAAPPVDPAPVPNQADTALEAVQEVRADIARALEDLERLKSANPLEKIRGVVALKADLAEIKGDARNAVAEARGLKDDVQEKPLQYLWGLLGLIPGLIHRRFSH